MTSIVFAKVKKKRKTKKTTKKKVVSRKKKIIRKKSIKSSKNIFSQFKINKNNWIVFYYAAAYIGIFGLFAVAIFYSN